ncbi:hypothetical protein TNIN_344661 [Trichonephila inaurata madagascariensis]|uniref:Uncharacterized protein n=1 Tax=Trichonephila inaurata madagascariensis TaxID=2747483 RepID=A0A8X6X6Q2_9ARAC|nr:hypothetical protein TNIN_344661 [Trichonephila inaurata madagascariensis]
MRRGRGIYVISTSNQKTARSCIPLNTYLIREEAVYPSTPPKENPSCYTWCDGGRRRGIGPPSLSNRLRGEGGGGNPPIGRWLWGGEGKPSCWTMAPLAGGSLIDR